MASLLTWPSFQMLSCQQGFVQWDAIAKLKPQKYRWYFCAHHCAIIPLPDSLTSVGIGTVHNKSSGSVLSLLLLLHPLSVKKSNATTSSARLASRMVCFASSRCINAPNRIRQYIPLKLACIEEINCFFSKTTSFRCTPDSPEKSGDTH